MDELIGQILNQRYQIRSQLEKKTGRRTLLAFDTTVEIQVVIKLLIFDRDFDWQDLKLFEREAETLKSLEHPASINSGWFLLAFPMMLLFVFSGIFYKID